MLNHSGFTVNFPLLMFLAFVSVLYLFLLAELPLSLNPVAGKDDGLYIGLGRAIAEGNWLGKYSSTTHVKGVGYSIFLALNHWTGLSISVGHAVFHVAVTLIFVYAIFRITKSVMLVAFIFCAILLNPIIYSADMARVSRDIIYPYQTMLVVSLIFLTMHAKSQLTRVLVALFGGGALGWFWIMREESVWIVPGLALLFLVVPNRWSSRAQAMLIVGMSAFLVYGSVGLVNKATYGSWIVTELNGGAFPLAMNALRRVDVSPTVDQVPVTREARKQIYRISPSFASLANYIERPEMGQISCRNLPHTCGEIAGGWFHWVVRDAAQEAGIFSSTSKSKVFFIAITNEINTACYRGAIKCRPSSLFNLPRVELSELSQMPRIALHAIRHAIFLDAPKMDIPNSVGSEPRLLEASAFLNRPNMQPAGQYTEGFDDRSSNRAHAYLQFRTALAAGYALICKVLVPTGAISLLLLTAMHWRSLPIMIRLTWALVVLAATRIFLLSLVEVTSFRATGLYYLGPVSHLLVVAAMLSVYTFAETRKLFYLSVLHEKN